MGGFATKLRRTLAMVLCLLLAGMPAGDRAARNEKCAAEAIFNELSAMDGARKRAIHYDDNYTMNNWSKEPCLLVEMGFLANPDEDKKLNDPAYQARIVKGLINDICVYAGREKVH